VKKIKQKRAIPSSSLVKSFTPSVESMRTNSMQYPNLEGDAMKVLHEAEGLKAIHDAQETGDYLKADTERRRLDGNYLTHISFRLMDEDSVELKKMWAESFTDKSIDLYGEPDYEVAATLLENESNFGLEKARKEVFEYITDKYSTVYEAMDIDSREGVFSAEDIADVFEKGLEALVTIDSAWSGWSVVRNEMKDALSISGVSKSINIGMNRSSATPIEVKGIFAHEVLRHAQSRVNGNKIDKRLAAGLPGYLDFEEGLGTLYEYAVTGKVKDVIVDRYVDISAALGMGDRKNKVPRSEMLERALKREQDRNEARADGDKLSEEDIAKRVYAHVNRIYRGTPGSDEVVGVFTKDIVYYEGFMKAGRYIESQLEQGKSIDEVMDYLSQGKFDPTQPAHAAYVKSLDDKKFSTELVLYSQE
jgi:hypothetical protein